MIFITADGMRGDLFGEIARTEALLADLERIATGWVPSALDLESAPLLQSWVPTTRKAPALAGKCYDHALLAGPMLVTSEIQLMAPDLGWCRSVNRFYRLSGGTR